MSIKEKYRLTSEQQKVIVSLWKARIKSSECFEGNAQKKVDWLTLENLIDFSLSKTLIDMLEPNEDFPCVFHISWESYERLKKITGVELNVMVGDVQWIERLSEINFSRDLLNKWFDYKTNTPNANCIELEIARLIFTKSNDGTLFRFSLKDMFDQKLIVRTAFSKCNVSHTIKDKLQFEELINFVR